MENLEFDCNAPGISCPSAKKANELYGRKSVEFIVEKIRFPELERGHTNETPLLTVLYCALAT